jgi:uncharacterized protein (TIGR01244 family)
MRTTAGLILAIVGLCSVAIAGAQTVTKEKVTGVANFAQVETTVGCGGVITKDAFGELKRLGFKSVFDLQLATEPGADVEGEAAAAKAAGLNFIHVPFAPATPDNASVDKFLTAVVQPANEPAFIHCAGGNRAAGFWFIKRVLLDKWDTARAMQEAEALGLSSAPMKQFATNYVESHQR